MGKGKVAEPEARTRARRQAAMFERDEGAVREAMAAVLRARARIPDEPRHRRVRSRMDRLADELEAYAMEMNEAANARRSFIRMVDEKLGRPDYEEKEEG